MAGICWKPKNEKVESMDDHVEVMATCKTDATAGSDGKIQLDVEVHTRPSRARLAIEVTAKVGNEANLTALLELCSKLKKDRNMTLLVTPGEKEKGHMVIDVTA